MINYKYIYYKFYAMFSYRIKDMLLAKGISKPYTWLGSIGIDHNAAYRLLGTKKITYIPLAQLCKVCEAAHCTPNDLIVWDFNHKKSTVTPEDAPKHPLYAIRPREATNLAEKLKKLTPEQLRALEESIDGMGSN